jgi:hypothetical protein
VLIPRALLAQQLVGSKAQPINTVLAASLLDLLLKNYYYFFFVFLFFDPLVIALLKDLPQSS